jgi:uncharacterized protein YlxW (UPF0749 family)
MKKLEGVVNIVAIVLLLALGATALVVMQKTTESNAISTNATVRQSKKQSRVAKEVRLLNIEMRNLQKDVAEIRKRVKDQKSPIKLRINK